MRPCTWIAALAGTLLLAATTATAAPSAPTPRLQPGELSAFVDGAVRGAMAGDHVAGVTVAVVQAGRPPLLAGYGVAALEPLRPVDPRTTRFRVGSVSKTFTWILLMREVERGRIRLDDPVDRRLPPELRIPDQGFQRPIRIVDLMSHAGGLADSEYGHLIVRDPARLRPMEDYLRRHMPPRVREPGLASSYSNQGAALAGVIVARLNGLAFEDLAQRDIFGPLGMTHATFAEPYPPGAGLPAPMPAAAAAELSRGFDWTGDSFLAAPPELLGQTAPAGAASMTAEDAARYMSALLADGGPLYGPRTALAFRTPILARPTGVNGWAHGFVESWLPGGRRGYGHSGATLNFHSNLVVVPELGLGVFVAANTSSGRDLVQRLPGLVVQALHGPAPAPMHRAGSPALVREAGAYEGTYLNNRRAYAGLELFVELFSAAGHVSVTPDGRLHTAYGRDATWVPTGVPGRFVAADGDDLLSFRLDRAGRAAAFYLPSGNGEFERAPWWRTRAVLDACALAGLAAAGLAVAVPLRLRRLPATRAQAAAGWLALAAGATWLAAAAAFWRWLPELGDLVMYDRFPGPWLGAASVLASLAALLATSAALAAPVGFRPGGWPLWRALLHVALVAPLLSLGLLVALWGGLGPWP